MAVDIEIKGKAPRPKLVEIAIPAGLAIPEGLEEGEVFDLTGSYRIGPGGGLQTVAIEGIEIPTGEEVAEVEEETDAPPPDALMNGLTQMLG